jgi:hypothetical protein
MASVYTCHFGQKGKNTECFALVLSIPLLRVAGKPKLLRK